MICDFQLTIKDCIVSMSANERNTRRQDKPFDFAQDKS